MSKKLDEAYLETLDKITDLKQQLAEKDKEIAEYHRWLDRYSVDPYQIMLLIEGLKSEKKNICHQVCDEIRHRLHSGFNLIPTDEGWAIIDDKIEEILNQVEGK